MDNGDDDMFLRESRVEVEAARRLLDRHPVATATVAQENCGARTSVPTPAAVAEKEGPTAVKKPAGTIGHSGGEASAEKCAIMQPRLSASSNYGEVAEAEEASRSSSRSARSRPSNRSEGVAASGRGGAAGDFYRAALSTHISFIATTPADDPPPRLGLPDGRAIEVIGRKPAGGVGEACRALQGDVAGVRQVR